jgi:hypothetical protein
MIFGVLETALDADVAQVGYDLPANCHHVLAVEHLPPGPTAAWIPLMRWRTAPSVSTSQIHLYGSVTPGTGNVRIRYARNPPSQLALSDDLETTYGYTAAHRDVFVKGAVANLLAFTEPSRIQASSVEAHMRSEAVPAGSATSAARFMYQLFRQRLEDEAKNLQLRYPIAMHFQR